MEKRTGPFNVLLVDTDRDLIGSLSDTLSGEGYGVQAANQGDEALRIIKESRIDVLLADVDIPIISGFDLAGLVKEKSPDTVIILMTDDRGYSSPDDAVAAGADHCIIKPFECEKITNVLNNITGFKATE